MSSTRALRRSVRVPLIHLSKLDVSFVLVFLMFALSLPRFCFAWLCLALLSFPFLSSPLLSSPPDIRSSPTFTLSFFCFFFSLSAFLNHTRSSSKRSAFFSSSSVIRTHSFRSLLIVCPIATLSALCLTFFANSYI